MARSGIRHTWLAVGSLIATASCSFQASFDFSFVETAREEFSLSAASEGVTALLIDWDVGAVGVRVDDAASEITATGEKNTGSSSPERAEAALDGLEITLLADEADPARLVLAFAVPDPISMVAYAADVEVVLPTSLAIEIIHDLGEIAVTGNADTTMIELDAGTVLVAAQSGDTTVDADNATVEVDSDRGSVTVAVDHGSIVLRARPANGESVVARLDAGTIDFAVAAETTASLTLDAGLGAVEASLSEFIVTDLETRLDRVTATLNGGGAEIIGEVAFGHVAFDSL